MLVNTEALYVMSYVSGFNQALNIHPMSYRPRLKHTRGPRKLTHEHLNQ